MRLLRPALAAALPAVTCAVLAANPAHAVSITTGDYACVASSPAPRLVNSQIEWYADVTCEGDGWGPKWLNATLEKATCDGALCARQYTPVAGPVRSPFGKDCTRVSRVAASALCTAADPPKFSKALFRVFGEAWSEGGAKHEQGYSEVAELACG
ncbi:hypothetical protein ACFC6U_40750 [Kitasatospora purpeofusca]|uniref:hypothetical protein n=1 Tax=Kitasatospora purpeofusca TaxID=67352 RepID=UPI0035D89BE7